MDIEEIRVARREMEDTIRDSVYEAMKVFHAKTGMCPQSIDVRFVDVTTMGERERLLIVDQVIAYVPL